MTSQTFVFLLALVTVPCASGQDSKHEKAAVSGHDHAPYTSEQLHFDHAQLDRLLKAHVDKDGYVNYAALEKDKTTLNVYLGRLAKAGVDRLPCEQDKLSYWINAYNACTLRLILDHYPLKSIMDIPEAKRWKDRRWLLGGRRYSLDEIENEVIRKRFKEPRIHFAVNCASIGCPPLRNEAYTALELNDQLAEQARYVHRHDRWCQFDDQHNQLKLTKVYEWYPQDFQAAAESIPAYVAQFVPALRRHLAGDDSVTISYLEWDWSLNDQRRR